MSRSNSQKAFSLIEVLVSAAILSVILLVVFSAVQHTTAIWTSTTGRIEKFQKTREAFDLLSKRIATATLNTYWDYDVPLGSGTPPNRYERQSELRLRSGPAHELVGGSPSAHPGHAIFFQAPGGLTTDGSVALHDALNTWGYFIEYGSEAAYRPPFLNSVNDPRFRYRLIEMMEPSDQLSIYNFTSEGPDNPDARTYDGSEWFQEPFALPPPLRKRVLADNVVLLLIAPRLASADDPTGAALSSDFRYDTTQSNPDARINPRHQLPPMLEVTLVTIDENSARRLDWGATPPDLGYAGLFGSVAERDAHLETFLEELDDLGLSHRTFHSVIDIPASRWSTEQEN